MINKHDIGSIDDNNNNNEGVTMVIILVTINRYVKLKLVK